MQKHKLRIESGRTNTLVLSLLAVGAGIAIGVAGCNNDDDGGPGPIPAPFFTATPRPIVTPIPGTTATAVPGATATARPGATATARPGSTATPRPGATATPRPGATATATTPATSGPLIGFETSGTFSGGQYTQSDGQFFRFTLQRETPGTPIPDPTADPNETPQPSLAFVGTYTLSDGSRGTFVLDVDVPGTDASGGGFPNIPEGFTINPASFSPQGTATVTLQIAGSTGSGRVSLSNGLNGTINITQRIAQSSVAVRAIPRSLRAYIKRH